MRSLIHCIGWGILYGISFIIPPYSLPLFSFLCRISVSSIALIKLMDSLYRSSSISQAFLKGWLFSSASFVVSLSGIYSAFQLVHQFWLYIPCLLFLGIGLGLLTGFTCIIPQWGARKNKFIFSILFAGSFVFGEFFRGHFIIPFPWNFLSHIFSFDESYIALCLIQCVKFLSIYSLSLIWLLFLGSIFYGEIKWIGLMMTSLIGIFIFGHFQLIRPIPRDPSPIRILIVQPNTPQAIKLAPEFNDFILKNTCQLTLKAQKEIKEPCDLIIWPETAVTHMMSERSTVLPVIQKCIKGKSILVFGADRTENNTESKQVIWHNSMYVVSPHKIIDIYDKIELLPFGEYIPYRDFFPAYLNRFIKGVDCTPGVSKEIKINSELSFHPLICSESIYTRSLSKNALFTLQILNDGWFNSSILWQHLAADRLRTIESRRPTVRVSNNGISGLITATGQLKKMLSIGQSQYGIITISHAR